jgi:imidazoleglycerol-phosphate dehydratase
MGKIERKAEISRKTNETDVELKLDMDGRGRSSIDTGIGFFNHMLELFAKHGLFDFWVKASGDLDVDYHHSVEDVGIVLGQAIRKALGSMMSVKRYGSAFVPMDEALALVAVDIGGRPFLIYDAGMDNEKVGEIDTELFEEFFRAVAVNAAMNIHIKVFYGNNNHHRIEAVFKAFGRALREAAVIDSKIEGVMSTKGII